MKDVTAHWRGLAHVIRAGGLRLVGIAGAPGSGKSTFAKSVAAELDDAFVMSTDDYYLSKAERPERGMRWRSAHDLPALLDTLDGIRSGRGPVSVQRFSGDIDDRIDPVVLERVPSHVLLEGFVLGNRADGYDQILERLDLLVFLDVDEATAKKRRFGREAELRSRGGGFSEEEMQAFWDEVLEPGMKRWLHDARAAADVVVVQPDDARPRSVRTSSELVLRTLDRR